LKLLFWMVALLSLQGGLSSPARADMRLIMFQEPGCVWCEMWRSEVGVVYKLTAEGKEAPLWAIDISDPLPARLKLDGSAYYTPTFVLIDDDVEVGRIEGYPGEAFFWGLLEQMIARAKEKNRS